MENTTSNDGIRNVIARPMEALLGYLLFYFGSWHLFMDFSAKALYKLGFSDSFILQEWGRQIIKDNNPSLLWGKHSILVKVNESYYGFICGEQFFDSPVIQWVMLSAAIYLITDAVWHFIFDFKGTL